MGSRIALAVNRHSIEETELRSESMPELADGDVRVRVDHVAITANTVSYAQFGDVLGYWSFYPLDAAWGYVPATGWGTVVESRVAGIDVGAHLHGWYPMASTVDFTATPTQDGFRDDGPHRSAHAPIYRTFVASDRDAMYTGAVDEERHSLLRILYVTGHLIRSFLAAERFAGVEQSIVMSASSKTAIGYAFASRRAHAASGAGPALVGVTSAGNADFVRTLGLYDRVITYGEIDSTDRVPSVVVDMAGAGAAVAAAHAHLGDLILHSMIVGKSHHDAPGAGIDGGPRPELFFAPTEVERRISELGAAQYRSQLAAAVAAFIDGSRRWLEIEHHRGPNALQAAWALALSGAVAPSIGLIASMDDSSNGS